MVNADTGRRGAVPQLFSSGWDMFNAVALTYGMLMSFVLSGATRNVKLMRPHPPVMVYLGYLLCGVTVGLAILCGLHALGLIALL